jgi:hypothetical protein
MISKKVGKAVTPAKAVPPAAGWIPAEIYPPEGGGGNDENGTKRTFYESINIVLFSLNEYTDFGELPSTSSGPEPVEGSRAE